RRAPRRPALRMSLLHRHGPGRHAPAHADRTGPVLEVERLGVRYGERQALGDVTFAVGRGELLAVVGPNGAGKSSMFKAICGLVNHDGIVEVNGVHCHHRTDRMDIAYIPQRSDHDLAFPITVIELVLAGRRRFRRWWQPPSADDRAAALDALRRVRLADAGDRPLGELSGGQLQRAFLARALAQEASVVLLDEALGGVDQPTTEELFDLFRTLAADGTTLLVSTHDLALARRRFDRCLAVNGTLRADGDPADVLSVDTLETIFGSASPVVVEPAGDDRAAREAPRKAGNGAVAD
ncbi:MAG: metal ABC transporter ATP-binding protein, partial [Ilumatobacteraceae bacterium]